MELGPLMVTKPPDSDFVTARLIRLITWICDLFEDGRFWPREKYRGCHLELKDKTILLLNRLVFLRC